MRIDPKAISYANDQSIFDQRYSKNQAKAMSHDHTMENKYLEDCIKHGDLNGHIEQILRMIDM